MAITDIAQSLSTHESTTRLPQYTSTVYGTAVADSENGVVKVVMDGEAVTQPEEETTEIVVEAKDFEDGKVTLPSMPYLGTLSVAVDGEELTTDKFQIDDNVLTISELVESKAVEVSYLVKCH